MKQKMAELLANVTEENTVEIQALPRPAYKEEKNNQYTSMLGMCEDMSLGLIQDKYEEEFEKIMQEQDQQHIFNKSDKNCHLNNTRIQFNSMVADKPKDLNEHEVKIRIDLHPCRPEATKSTPEIIVAKPSSKSQSVDKYPSELNPFAEDERGHGTNPFGDSDEEESPRPTPVQRCSISTARPWKEHGTNPFGDSDEEESPRPTPVPRRRISTARPWKEDQDNRTKLPIPLPRTLSRSMPSTPNQSPRLRANRSFRLPGSGSSLAGSNVSAYNSIRRKKKPAPPPPNNSPSTPSVSTQSPTTSTLSNNRPRKSRKAPPPPPSLTAPSIGKLQYEISSLSLQDSK